MVGMGADGDINASIWNAATGTVIRKIPLESSAGSFL